MSQSVALLNSVLVTAGITGGGRRHGSDALRHGRKMHPSDQELLCIGELNQQLCDPKIFEVFMSCRQWPLQVVQCACVTR